MNNTEPSALPDADLLALSVIWEHRRQRQAAGVKILLLPFVPCPACGAPVDEVIIGPQDQATFRQAVTMQPCGHRHTVSEDALLRLQEHVGEMLTDIEDADRRGKGASVEAIVREAHDRTTPDNPPTSQDAADNPPGSTREQLPADILALFPPSLAPANRSYLSHACRTARLVDGLIIQNPGRDDLPEHRDRLHQDCAGADPYTGTLCHCPCHPVPVREVP